MRLFLVVHGFVQGVGYRHLVYSAAKRNGIAGMVRNAEDGSVEILAEGKTEDLQAFEKEINTRSEYGPQVLNIERFEERNPKFPKAIREYREFVIEKGE